MCVCVCVCVCVCKSVPEIQKLKISRDYTNKSCQGWSQEQPWSRTFHPHQEQGQERGLGHVDQGHQMKKCR